MASQDPLKTVMSIQEVDDTSLALPSTNQLRSGQQRVREQVRTVKRTKSRQSSRSGSTSMSPTSPSYESVFGDASKSQSSTSNGGIFFGNGFSKALNLERNANRQTVISSVGSSVKRHTAASTHQHERRYAPVGPPALGQANTSRSEPDMAWQRSMMKRSAPPRRFFSNISTGVGAAYRAERTTSQMKPSTTSQPHPHPHPHPHYTVNSSQDKTISQHTCSRTEAVKTQSKPPAAERTATDKVDSGLNPNSGVTDMTMKEAVECLSHSDEAYQNCGASYIQHNTFIDDKAKEEALKLNGIPPLVGLLRSPSPQVSQTASAALRNLSFKNESTKEAIHRHGGIAEAVNLLRDIDSVEIQKQLTGLLWNLSSAESLKPDLLKSALPVLMESVILPYTAGPEPTNNISQDPEVFFHATGCLRNLSSAKQNNRQTMRKCRGLVDSMVGYVTDCVDKGKPDDKSVENCMCVLHNLTFQLEAEAPTLFSRMSTLAKSFNRSHSQSDAGPISCFSPQSKSAEQEYRFDFPVVEDSHPSGAALLLHSNTLQTYLKLLGSSKQEETQEACCGALQNLTAHEGVVSSVISQTIVQKLKGMNVIAPLIRSDKVSLQRNIVALVGNLTKNRNLHSAIAHTALPELLGVIGEGTEGGNESDDTLAMACQSANCLLMKEPDTAKKLLNPKLIDALGALSKNNYFPKSSKAAALTLYNLWSDKDLQSFLKKQGMNKESFVNDITTAAHKSVQVVD